VPVFSVANRSWLRPADCEDRIVFLTHRRRIHKGSRENAPVLAAQLWQKCQFPWYCFYTASYVIWNQVLMIVNNS